MSPIQVAHQRMDIRPKILLHIIVARWTLPFFTRATATLRPVQPKLHHPRFYRREFPYLVTAETLASDANQTCTTTAARFRSAVNDHIWFLSSPTDTHMAWFSAAWLTQAFFATLFVANGWRN